MCYGQVYYIHQLILGAMEHFGGTLAYIIYE